MTMNDMQRYAHLMAIQKGWWPINDLKRAGRHDPEALTVKLALVTTEVAEAIECVRDGQFETSYDDKGKPIGLPVEMADAVIRLMDLAGAMGIDLEAVVEAKMDYNATRPHRHGGKLL